MENHFGEFKMDSCVALSPTTFLERTGRTFPKKKALISFDKVITYGELLHRSRCLAQVLKRLKVRYGDRVAVLAENGPQVIEAHFGVPSIGAILVMLNPWLTTIDLVYMLSYCEATVLILDADFAEKIPPEIRDALTHLKHVLIFNNRAEDVHVGTVNYEATLAAEDGKWLLDQTVYNELDPLAINYTSGTTGRPKGVICTHRGAYLNAIGQVLMIRLNKSSKYLWMLPMFHVNGWGHMWANAAVGAEQILISHKDRADQVELINMLTKHKITHLCGAPRFVRLLIEAQVDPVALKGLTITTGGAAPSVKLIESLFDRGISFVHQYGLNETYGPYVVCEDQDEWKDLPAHVRALNFARQGVPTIHAGTGLRVVNEDMQDVPCDGQTLGEVIMAGNTVTPGYYNNPQATEKAVRHGWFHSGDMAVVHPDGYLEIRDRIKDLIYVETDYGWENISSLEIENVLCKHPQVREAAVIGISVDNKVKSSPILIAFVEVLDTTLVTESDLLEFCVHELAPHKQPRMINFVSLPKTATGKIRKDLLVTDTAKLAISSSGLDYVKTSYAGQRQKLNLCLIKSMNNET